MTMWHLLSPPLMSMTLLLTTLTTTLTTTINTLQSNNNTILEWEILNCGPTNMTFPIMIDKFSLIFSLTVMLISLNVMIFTTSYMSNDPNMEYFTYMVMLFVLSMNLLIFIPNLFFLLLGWDGLGLTSYLLVIYYQNDKSLSAGMVTAMTNRIGDALLILASAWTLNSSHWNFTTTSTLSVTLIPLMIMMAAMTKSAQLPFSAWLPAAMAAPTPVSALVHSSTLVTAGVYLLIRFYPTLTIYKNFIPFLLFTGSITCMMASMAANYEYDLKKVIALSTLSQLGVMMMAIGLNQPNLAFFHLITHALFKALLFLCAGTIIHSKQNNQDLRMMGNLWNTMPATCTTLNMANMALCGLPFLAGFYSKDTIIETWMTNSFPLTTSTLLITCICLTSTYSMRMSILTLWSPFKSTPMSTLKKESNYNHLPHLTLLTGSIMGGALLSWTIIPNPQTTILPIQMKTLATALITLLATMAYWTTTKNKTTTMTHFMSSMWFLTTLTSPPQVQKTLSLSKTLYYNESTWLEHLSGGSTFIRNPKTLQTTLHTQWMTSPQLMYIPMIITLIYMTNVSWLI